MASRWTIAVEDSFDENFRLHKILASDPLNLMRSFLGSNMEYTMTGNGAVEVFLKNTDGERWSDTGRMSRYVNGGGRAYDLYCMLVNMFTSQLDIVRVYYTV